MAKVATVEAKNLPIGVNIAASEAIAATAENIAGSVTVEAIVTAGATAVNLEVIVEIGVTAARNHLTSVSTNHFRFCSRRARKARLVAFMSGFQRLLKSEFEL